MKNRLIILLLFLLSFEFALSEITIKGTIRNFEGKTPPMSYVSIIQYGYPRKLMDVESTGEFRFTIPDTLMTTFSFGAVDCNSVRENILIPPGTSLIEMDVRLEHLPVIKETNYYLIGNFNGFNMEDKSIPFKRDDRGTLTAVVDWQHDTLLYQILMEDPMIGDRSFNGRQSDFYVYDGGGDYRSAILGKPGNYTITFDPDMFASFSAPAEIKYKATALDRSQSVVRIADNYYTDFGNAVDFILYGQFPKDTIYPMYRQIRTEYKDSIRSLLKGQDDRLLRSYVILRYFQVSNRLKDNQALNSTDSNLARELFTILPPESKLWETNDFDAASVYAAIALNEFPGSGYLDALLKAKFNKSIEYSIYEKIIEQLMFRKDEKAAKKYYSEYAAKHPDKDGALFLELKYFTEKKIKLGAPLPSFTTKNMDDSTITIDYNSLKGKYVLIDIWAIGCGGCQQEMKYLDSAYKRLEDRNFTIFSVNIEDSPSTINEFRKKNWPMPWLHAAIDRKKDKMIRDFNITWVPRPILVDPDGKIIALDSELRGERLFKTLEKYLGKL